VSALRRPLPAARGLRDTERLVAPAALAQTRTVLRIFDEDAPPPEGLDAPQLLGLYRQLVTVRLVRAALPPAAEIEPRRPDHAAAIVGAVAALAPADWLFPDPGDRGALLVRGATLASYFAQAAGAAGDPAKGRTGPAEPARRGLNVVSVATPLGMHLTQATGAAWAARLRHDAVVVMASCTTAATSGDEFHVAVNFAGVMRAPVVFVCHTSPAALAHETAAESVAVKGLAYEVPGRRADGGDLLAVYAACRAAVTRARRGEGPTLIEAVAEPASGARDPLTRLERYLVARGVLAPAAAAALQATAAAEVAAARDAAVAAARPPAETLVDDVYADLPGHLSEQRGQVRG
jgi:pyruvate dehydrogenase E1 component alpha subunit/2-oxoisovalerate dehydrogenase E1 component alpha subunit